ncbi:RNA-binding protein Cwf29 [Coprinopsis cinerea okayama7|uniref:RNA-binding protein Cwf29 n=1 Tax=Coprinopsis cinerea (strain Okayama-7 / 130 / ATCC MYA-4618 / FGSC 9003) TaxID=240176 RepID=A8NYW8_COPC7|nr:RNA-binding protein Cwf29 [Coprinopsis cinerea okayama7\|eukprot:XP_001837545.2 RNA-binding protein Cwf29 [Coprinopsis cinerea okayama7\
MNVVREINAINQRELELGLTASWHDEYKDSARIFVGGLHNDLTEGDVITIFSQYGEIMDINMPRDKETGKPRGFAFLMYEDQRSTILAVDNLNGAKVLERTLRVDHVKQYKQPKVKNADGEWVEQDEEVFNAAPELIEDDGAESDSSDSTGASIDPEDPMRDYLIAQRREAKAKKKGKEKKKSKSKHKDETPEERAARKARKREKKEKKKAKKGKSEVWVWTNAMLGGVGTVRGPQMNEEEGTLAAVLRITGDVDEAIHLTTMTPGAGQDIPMTMNRAREDSPEGCATRSNALSPQFVSLCFYHHFHMFTSGGQPRTIVSD